VLAGSAPTKLLILEAAVTGVAWDAVPEPMVEYIDPDFTKNLCSLWGAASWQADPLAPIL
jgi:hypothetical protein